MSNVVEFPNRKCKKDTKEPAFAEQLVQFGYFSSIEDIPSGLSEFILANLQVCYDEGYKRGGEE